ncbi:hypothetical protein POM88_030693 [Heracleum sosnowskyi]|uniref:Uncharacterized protein n=1 Tax=Heracleum sosnowskyi TaxID=360622 RepID=A0AAD8HZ07_9APIA|nr:hypothetical protein POM88_030693 [Heracleum sosnowskyi]
MEKNTTNLPFVLVLLLAISGAFLRSGRVEAMQESVIVNDCKISCENGSPKLLNGEWTCVDVVRQKQMIISTPEMMSTGIKSSSSKDGCDGLLAKCQGMYCNDLKDCGHCCGRTQAPFCMKHQCACW